MSFSSNLITTGRALLLKYGSSITFTRVTEGTYSRQTNSFSGGNTSNYSAYGIPVEYKDSEVDGTIIKSGDTKLILAKPTSATPKVSDTCTVRSTVYRVENVMVAYAQGTDIVYTLQLRKHG